jgi:phage shock protein A
MALRLFDRITLLLKADAHGVVEALEERSLLLKQYLREAEIELNQKAARLEAVREEEQRLRDGLTRLREEIQALDDDVNLALAGGKDDLARFAIRRLIPRRHEAAALQSQIEQRGAEARALEERLAAQRTQFDSLRARVRCELARESAASASPSWPGEAPVADQEVELELMRRRKGEGGPPS